MSPHVGHHWISGSRPLDDRTRILTRIHYSEGSPFTTRPGISITDIPEIWNI